MPYIGHIESYDSWLLNCEDTCCDVHVYNSWNISQQKNIIASEYVDIVRKWK